MIYDLFDTQKEVIQDFINEMDAEMKHIRSSVRTKKEVMSNLDQWINTIETIKHILKHEE